MWPAIGLFFREKELLVESNLKGADLWVDHIFICIGIDVFVLCYFEGDKVTGYHVAYNFKLWEVLIDHFADWLGTGVR
ncbi:MAG: hypothetical protein KDD45_07350, partial [Bdellovibrionales bacterium]|nr:hypothetical protein [Bdellovibrionales bacterium]